MSIFTKSFAALCQMKTICREKTTLNGYDCTEMLHRCSNVSMRLSIALMLFEITLQRRGNNVSQHTLQKSTINYLCPYPKIDFS